MRAVLVLSAVLLSVPGVARACASCGCGDPTLTQMGAEKPFAGRIRLSAEGQSARTTIQGVQVLDEQRLDLAASWAPAARVILGLRVPVAARAVAAPNLSRTSAVGVGDSELAAKIFLWEDRPLFAHHLLAAIAGV